MRAAKVTRPPARIVTVSPADWDARRRKALAQRSTPKPAPAGKQASQSDLYTYAVAAGIEVYRKLVQGIRDDLAKSEAALAEMEARASR